MRSAVCGVVLGALCAVMIAACAMATGGSHAPSVASQSQSVMPDRHADITDLDGKITSARVRMGLPAPVAPLDTGSATQMAATPPTSTDPTCHHGDGDVCHDSCSLADDICVNAKKICDLAQQMPDDRWAADKCTSGAQSCDAAHARCCGCQ